MSQTEEAKRKNRKLVELEVFHFLQNLDTLGENRLTFVKKNTALISPIQNPDQ